MKIDSVDLPPDTSFVVADSLGHQRILQLKDTALGAMSQVCKKTGATMSDVLSATTSIVALIAHSCDLDPDRLVAIVRANCVLLGKQRHSGLTYDQSGTSSSPEIASRDEPVIHTEDQRINSVGPECADRARPSSSPIMEYGNPFGSGNGYNWCSGSEL